MKKFLKSKKGVASLVTLAALAAAIGAYAYFTSGGSGSGSGSTATPAALTISEVGAGYDSLIPTNNYWQDQCMNCAGLSDFGNQVNLAGASGGQYVRLTGFTVALRNRSSSTVTALPLTVTVGGYVAHTTITLNGNTTGNATFDFTNQDAFVTNPVLYDIAYNSNDVNVALSDSRYDVSVGGPTPDNSVWLETEAVAPTGSPDDDFPAGTVFPTPGTFGPVGTNTGPSAPANPGAYGNFGGVTDSADIPAVEIDIVGGVAPALAPGQTEPVNFAVTNPGTTAAELGTLTTTITGNSKDGSGCNSGWYSLTGGGSSFGAAYNQEVQPGTTTFLAPSTTISMSDPSVDQSACEGASVNLSFTSN